MAKVLRFLLPDAQVDFVSAFTVTRRFPKLVDLMAHADGYDHVYSSIYLPRFKDGGTIDRFRTHPKVRLIPTIVFGAYHPDLIHVGVQDAVSLNGLISGPMGHSHSAITLYAYLADFSQAQALRLFAEPVFERLGYFDLWNESVAYLRGLGAQAQYDLDTHLTRWARRGCFMHSINHTKLYVVADLARGLLTKSGVAYPECDLDAFVPDDLGGQGSWPVYPEIGAHYGIPGSALFFKAETRRSGPARTMTRPEFVAAAYANYDKRPREALVSRRVQDWRNDPATVDFFREAAGRDISPIRPSGRSPALASNSLAGHAS